MRTARSARALVALGATLIACSLSVTATAEQLAGFASGITVGDAQGISVGDAAGITIGDTAGITIGDTAGITIGDTAGITIGDTAGITIGDTAGITIGDIAGITIGDTAGITIGDTAGITIGDIAGITIGDTAGITIGDTAGITIGDSSVLSGPVDRIDHVNGVFESMGQIVMASRGALAGMRVGDFVSVQGSVVSPGWLYADGVSVSDTLYVPGATEVFVTGMLSSVDRAAGTARVGGLTIDYTSSLGSSRAPSDAMWSFSGTRPAAGGVMISDRTGGLR